VFAGKKSAQIREILISESAWEEMTCLFAPSLAHSCPKAGLKGADMSEELTFLTSFRVNQRGTGQLSLISLHFCLSEHSGNVVDPFTPMKLQRLAVILRPYFLSRVIWIASALGVVRHMIVVL
jgi:hypothetical protein